MDARPRLSLVHILAAFLAVGLVNGCGSSTEPTQDPTISLTISPTSATVEQGGSVVVTGTATVGGSFTGTAAVTVSGVPGGVTGTVGAPQTAGSSTTVPVTIDVGAAVAPGSYPITVRAAGSSVSAEQTFTLTVEAGPQYTLDIAPGTLSIEQGTSDDAVITLVRTNFTGTVNLRAEDAPTGMTVSFTPDAVTGDGSEVTVSVGGSVAAGTYNLTIVGEATGTALADRMATLDVTVTAPAGPAFALSATPDELMLDPAQGALTVAKSDGPALASSGTVTVEITRLNDHTADVEFDLMGAPQGVTAVFEPNPATGDASELTIQVGPSVATGEYTTSIVGDDGTLVRETALTLIIDPVPGYELSLDPEDLTIEQGTDGTTTVTVERMNFTDEVTLVLDGEPTGVTGAFSVNPVFDDPSTLTISVSEEAVPGEYELAVVGEASPLDNRNVTLNLTVTEAVGFSLGSVSDITIDQGASDTRTVEINRTGGFDGEVTIAISPAPPAGLTVAVDPTSTTGNSVTLTATASGSVTPQTYLFSLTGTAAGEPDAETSVDINVTEPSSGASVSLDFSVCEVIERPTWFAYKDGTSDWMPVTGVSDVYEFDVSSDLGSIAYVTTAPSGALILVQHLTQDELAEGQLVEACGTTESGTDVMGTLVGGVGFSNLTIGGQTAFAFADGPFTITNVDLGVRDFIGYSQDQGGTADRMLILRDQNITNGVDIGSINFTTNGFDPASGMITIGGLAGGESGFAGMDYATMAGSVCEIAPLQSGLLASPYTARGAPVAQQADGDYHVANVNVSLGSATRTVQESFEVLGDRTVTLGAAMPVPTVTDVTGSAGYQRLQAVHTLPADYDSYSAFSYSFSNWQVLIAASNGAMSGSTTLSLPDFTGLTGWNDAWGPPTGNTFNWNTLGIGQSGGSFCAEGARFLLAGESGSIS